MFDAAFDGRERDAKLSVRDFQDDIAIARTFAFRSRASYTRCSTFAGAREALLEQDSP
jgi:UDP-3-O-acyl-N-acetylglucosamine deacetylase